MYIAETFYHICLNLHLVILDNLVLKKMHKPQEVEFLPVCIIHIIVVQYDDHFLVSI